MCSKDATCQNSLGSYKCICKAGYNEHYNGKICVKGGFGNLFLAMITPIVTLNRLHSRIFIQTLECHGCEQLRAVWSIILLTLRLYFCLISVCMNKFDVWVLTNKLRNACDLIHTIASFSKNWIQDPWWYDLYRVHKFLILRLGHF